MNGWHSLLLLIGWMALLTVTGRALCRLLPWRLRSFARLFLAPLLGLAVYVLLATLVGWLSAARSGLIIPLTLAGLALCGWHERRQHGLLRHLALVSGLAVVVTAGLFLPIWTFGGYNVFNDTFTYLSHAQWLQHHDFRHYAAPTIYEPAVTQIAIYQHLGFRMGASFFLAWVQAASPFDWSIHVYPAVVGIALSCGSMAIGGVTYALAGNRRLSLGWSAAAGSGISGFAFGAFAGFLPQVFGLSLVAGFLGLLVRFRPRPAPFRRLLISMLPLSVAFAATGFAYSELLPLMTLSTGAWLAVLLWVERPFRLTVLWSALIFATQTLLLLNVECGRIAQALNTQKNAVVGWAVPWSIQEFAAHSFGLRSGSGDGDQWLLPQRAAVFVLALFVLAIGWGGFRPTAPRRERLLRWSAPLAYLGIGMVGFLYFRFGVHSPWPTGLGQSWNDFKLSNWLSPVLLATTGAGLVTVGARRAWCCWIAITALVALNLFVHLRLTPERIAESARLSGRQRDPFKTYLDMRQLAQSAEPKGVIYLDLGGNEHKSRQLAAYFLQDMKVAGDWGEDGYIYPFLPDGWQSLQPGVSQWWIRRSTAGAPNPNAIQFRSGSLVFAAMPDFIAARQSVSGGHGVESDSSGWWTWTSRTVRVQFKIHAQFPARVRVKFTCLVAAKSHLLTLTVRNKNGVVASEQMNVGEGWQVAASSAFQITEPDADIEISSADRPVSISATDSRSVTFLAKNVQVELAASAN